jgi:Mg-chelatase subunit ChlD
VNLNDVVIENMDADGGTPLLDAEGIAITETGKRLAVMDECDRPARVLVVIITDGDENMSQEYTLKQVSGMIKRQEDDYSWQFTFLGANIDAHGTGQTMGVKAKATMNFAADSAGVKNAFESLTSGSLRARSMCRSDYEQSVADGTFYTNAEQEQGDIDAKGPSSDDLQGSSS